MLIFISGSRITGAAVIMFAPLAKSSRICPIQELRFQAAGYKAAVIRKHLEVDSPYLTARHGHPMQRQVTILLGVYFGILLKKGQTLQLAMFQNPSFAANRL